MKYDDLQKKVSQVPVFDMAFLAQAFEEPRSTIRVQLSRWMADGHVISLRRGLYMLAEPYRKKNVTRPTLANRLCRPSYLSGLWALGFYGLIPEQVHWFTSVTSRGPQRYENPMGVFEYRHIKQDAFFAYERLGTGEGSFLIAKPEKALLDHWHLHAGEWTESRLGQMRYQNTETVDTEVLQVFAERFASPRLLRAVNRWIPLFEQKLQGGVIV